MRVAREEREGRRGSKPFDREDGSKISWYEVFSSSSFPKVAIAAIILLTACQPTVEEGKIDVFFSPGSEGVFKSWLLNHRAKCAFYDLDEEYFNYLSDDEVLIYYKNYHGLGKKVYSKGLMHNKFCVSNDEVITGSTNPTIRGFQVNDNNLVLVKSKTIAKNYWDEFNEIKRGKSKKTRKTQINLNGITIENYFCPEDSCEEKVLEALSKADNSIYFMVFSFTSDTIGELLLEKSKAIEVKGIMESFGLNKYSEYEKLEEFVILERTGKIMHHKVFIIDGKTVVTGSYNPTKNGNEKNDENILIIHNEGVASLFLSEFNATF